MGFQTTVHSDFVCAGIGVHSGQRARIRVRPAEAGSGLVFRRTDVDHANDLIPARGDRVSDVMLGSRLTNDDGVSVSTVEHLMAALAGMEVDNALIEIDGPEVPIMDGSSSVFCALIREAGLRELQAPRRRMRVLKTIEVEDGPRSARLMPSTGRYLSMRAQIEYDNSAIGNQTVALRFSPGVFTRDVAFARTYGFFHEVEYLRGKGLAQGGSLDNAVVIDGDRVMNPEGLRAEDEFVRHKVLDAVGDLALAGAPIAGHYDVIQPGHAINNLLVRALLEQTDAWTWETDQVPAREPLVSGDHAEPVRRA